MEGADDVDVDAVLRAAQKTIEACGGFRRVGFYLWPDMPLHMAERKLRAAIDPSDPSAVFSAEIAIGIGRLGRHYGSHDDLSNLQILCTSCNSSKGVKAVS